MYHEVKRGHWPHSPPAEHDALVDIAVMLLDGGAA